MLSFFRRVHLSGSIQQAYFPEGAVRRALAAWAGRAEPAPGDKARLFARCARARPSLAAGEPVYRGFGYGAHAGAPIALATLQASHMTWRLPWRSALAAWPLV